MSGGVLPAGRECQLESMQREKADAASDFDAQMQVGLTEMCQFSGFHFPSPRPPRWRHAAGSLDSESEPCIAPPLVDDPSFLLFATPWKSTLALQAFFTLAQHGTAQHRFSLLQFVSCVPFTIL